MTLLKQSCLYRLLLLLLAAYEDSGLHRLAVRVGAWCTRQIDESALLRPLCREGAVARSWPDSRVCQLLSWLINLPGRLLRKFYLLLEGTFENSFFLNSFAHVAVIKCFWYNKASKACSLFMTFILTSLPAAFFWDFSLPSQRGI